MQEEITWMLLESDITIQNPFSFHACTMVLHEWILYIAHGGVNLQSLLCGGQWWKVTKYIYSSILLEYFFDVCTLLQCFHFMLLYT